MRWFCVGCALPLSVEVVLLREELCTPGYYIAPNSQWRFPVWEFCVDKLVEILLCEGGDVELGARTSKEISVFVFDPLTLNSLSFTIVPCIISYCSFIYYMLGLFVCASLVFNHESFI